jgi:hypothetical protein
MDINYCEDCELRPATRYIEIDEMTGFGGPTCDECAVCYHGTDLDQNCTACALEYTIFGDEGAPDSLIDLSKKLK